jgi:hypothetical protein
MKAPPSSGAITDSRSSTWIASASTKCWWRRSHRHAEFVEHSLPNVTSDRLGFALNLTLLAVSRLLLK